ncbi:hypothetical protein G3N55_00650 [Dissulfurirhabdus thermomarina]|uniref:Uncharacterized protein n=1 Tax=Dissulfurirhabdus thermomarina TaxID=1765737 RepID=A0A6N9TLQ5_DISTH|nr:hypothetical protein [Dissulfurirhabdus thermomarina]NMX23257.1 hypothetical protein [Dissulfurirhabdus thermomarina]
MNDPRKRLSRKAGRRTGVAGIFPDRAAAIGLVGAVPVERNDAWAFLAMVAPCSW